jgi:hypothetical protein
VRTRHPARMDSVRTRERPAGAGVASGVVPFTGTRAPIPMVGARPTRSGVLVLDVIYLATTIALFVIVGLIAKGVEKV